MGTLRASAGKIDLEPPAGGWMTGFASRTEPSRGTHDPIMARGVLLDDGKNRLAVVCCDLLGFSPDFVAGTRDRIARASDIPASSILICCTHTHSGPTSLPMRGVLGYLDNDWLAHAQDALVEFVCGLEQLLEPAVMSSASITVKEIGFNRQDSSHAQDEELVAIALDSASGEPIASIINYATHAVVLGGRFPFYSADFPGAAASELERLRGGTGIYLQGACGDINPAVDMRGDYGDCERLGFRLAQEAASALSCADGVTGVEISTRSRIVDVPLDPPPAMEDLLETIRESEDIKKSASAAGESVQEMIAVARIQWASELVDRINEGAVPQSVPAEVFAAAVGDLRVVGLPFETYSDVGLGIKKGLKPCRTAFVGYANGLFGYCPTDRAKDQGGYGPSDSYRWFGALVTSVGYGAADLLVREAVSLARSL